MTQMHRTSIALEASRAHIGTKRDDKQALNHVSDTRQGHRPLQDASAYSITAAPTVLLHWNFVS